MPTRVRHATDRGDMKLILVPSNPNHGPRVSISVPTDGGLIDNVVSDLVVPILIAGGWHPQSVQDALRSVEVPGAVAEDETPPDDLTEWSAPASAPKPPTDFTVLGFNVVAPDPDEEYPRDDLHYYSGAASMWQPTVYADGQGYWYAARNGSETLAKLQAHVAAQ